MNLGHDRLNAALLCANVPMHRLLNTDDVEFSRAILETTLDGIVVIDLHGTIRSFNRAAQAIFGYDADDAIGMNVSTLMPEPYARNHDTYVQNYMTTRERKVIGRGREVTGKRKDGSVFPMELSVTEMVVAGQMMFVGSVRDISARKSAENQAEETRRRLETVVHTVPAAISYWTRDLRCSFASMTAATWLGKKPEEMLGARIDDVLGAEWFHHYEPHIRAVLRGEPQEFETMHTTSLGEIAHYVERYAPEICDDVVTGFIALITDVSEMRAVEKSSKQNESRFRSMLTNVPVSITHWTSDLRCTYANHASAGWFGRLPEEMPGIRMQDFLGDDVFRMNEPFVRQVLKGHPQEFERMTGKGGQTRHALVRYFPESVDGRVTGFLVITTDITAVKFHEEELEEARRTAEAANRAKSEFVANMSHEIRTPMNGVMGLAQLMLRTPLNDEQRTYVESICKSGDLLLTLINDLLDLAKVEAGEMLLEKRPMSIETAVAEVCDVLQIESEEKGIRLDQNYTSGPAPMFLGDVNRIKQIVFNVLGNAIKFTDKGSVTVDVDWRLRGLDGGLGDGSGDGLSPPAAGAQSDFASDAVLVMISVRDTGIGIQGKDMGAIFSPFFQGDMSPTKRHRGTGLGLMIAKQLAERMGGAINVMSAPGQGSTFEIVFPATIWKGEADSVGSSPAVRGAHDLSSMRILIAEDNPVNRMIMDSMLKPMGCFYEFAGDGREAVAKATEGSFDVVLMDVQMPVMDGLEATRRILQLPGKKPVILGVTARAMQEDIEKCLAVGMQDCVTKPLQLDQVVQRLRKLRES